MYLTILMVFLIRPDFNQTRFQMYRFLQSPPSGYVFEDYENKINTWNADVHLISTYCFCQKKRHKNLQHKIKYI